MTSKIEWTEETWNPLAGCSLESPGCTNCYAMKMAGRLEAMGQAAYQGTTQKSKAGFVWTGKVNLSETALLAPLKRKTPTVWFVNSMSDLFHPDVPDEWIDRIFAVMALCPQHTFQVLTKRSARMREYLGPRAPRDRERLVRIYRNLLIADGYKGDDSQPIQWPLPNVWLGVSVEDQARADQRIPDLLATPAAIRFLSCEPLLGPVFLRQCWGFNSGLCAGCETGGIPDGPDCLQRQQGRNHIDWVICGGESGPGSRPMHPDWARSLRNQCEAAGTAFFFKQWGDWLPCEVDNPSDGSGNVCYPDDGSERDFAEIKGPRPVITIGKQDMWRIGKKAAGRLLDGKTHDAMPATQKGGAA